MGRNTANEVATVAMTTNFDDDNTPSPKNTPQPNIQTTNGVFGFGVMVVSARVVVSTVTNRTRASSIFRKL